MKKIKLTQGKEALVSDCDYKYLIRWKWYFSRRKTDGYAQRTAGNPRQHIYMHRVIGARKGLKGKIDHKDRYRLNNQRPNLRRATGRQNQGNRRLNSNNTSGFKGVCWNKQREKWRMMCKSKTRRVILDFPGTQLGRLQAAYAYDVVAKAARGFGNFACLNLVDHRLGDRIKKRVKQSVLQQLNKV